ncbi:hypothetical protein FB567DRAFT_513557 [Paraphoma chrysanthemicola]|uniref:Uncharacterized protein n=1 Tax=Paraphoma chrysanthemicola TaxID=798071 RepID=A0A8K0RIX3_9PLEO|nr:hypothetical protein FB567DRAFT_513557 [Paraphoma chrysanthemicola]
MPAPPAYHSIVDPHAPVTDTRSPYDPEEEEKEDEEDTPEITINAATQVRGNGNIISIAQVDSVRIANLIAILLNGKIPQPEGPPQTPPEPLHGHTLPSIASMTGEQKPARQLPKLNITINCGATVIGDRNIVGPGLGDIARQMQLAQRNAALQRQQQAQAQAQAQGTCSTEPKHETLYQAHTSIAQHHGLFPTPPMSRSSSASSGCASGVKRKSEDDAREDGVKRQC